MSDETEIQTEVDALKTRTPETKALYREVCALLFFRFGITPTVSKLYQLVRKGSMSAPTDALSQFWSDLRSKARVEIDHPDLPDEVKDAAASAIAAIWRQASAAAREELRAVREEARAELTTVQSELQAARAIHDSTLAHLETARQSLTDANAATEIARSDLETEHRAHLVTAARNQELQRQLTELHAAQESARVAFAAEMDKSRAAVAEAIDRAGATERRALLELDQERQARNKAEKSLEAVRVAATQTEDRLRSDVHSMSESNVRLSGKVDSLEAANRKITASFAEASAAADELRSQLRQSEDESAHAKTEAQTLQGVIERLTPVPPRPAEPTTVLPRRSKPRKP